MASQVEALQGKSTHEISMALTYSSPTTDLREKSGLYPEKNEARRYL
jgi:hypothetical protein